MLKKILYGSMVLVLTAGAVYSYQQTGFSRKTLMFFQVWLGGQSAMGGPPGGGPQMGGQPGQRPEGMPGMNGQRPEGSPGMPGQQSTSSEAAAGGNAPSAMGSDGSRPNFQQDGNRGQGPPNGMKGGPPGGYLSLRNVWKYTVLFAFFTLITRMIDTGTRKLSRKRRG